MVSENQMFCFALDKTPALKIFCEPENKNSKKSTNLNE